MPTPSTETMKAQIQRGIEKLNIDGPANWRSRIDRATLDQGDGTRCVLGQIYGSYPRGCAALGIFYGTGRHDCHYGFNTRHPRDDKAYTDAWLIALAALDLAEAKQKAAAAPQAPNNVILRTPSEQDAANARIEQTAAEFIRLLSIVTRTTDDARALRAITNEIATTWPAADVALFCFHIRDALGGVALTQFVNRIQWSN